MARFRLQFAHLWRHDWRMNLVQRLPHAGVHDAEARLRVLRGSALTLRILTAALIMLLPTLNVRSDAAEGSDGSPVVGDADQSFEFRLKVVGPDKTPVPHANIEIRTSPLPTADQLQRGEFVRSGNYGTIARTDDEGQLALTLPRKPHSFSVKIQQPGYGPYWAGWSNLDHDQPFPKNFTAELDQGWTVGGVVVDGSGMPVADARVHPSVVFKKRPGDSSELHVGTRLSTDSEGKWQFEHVPVSMADVHVAIDHPNYQPLRRSLPRDGFEVKPNEVPSAPLELSAGLMLSGRVTDEAGKPIEGALVRTKFLNDVRQAITDASGAYRIVGCEPSMTQVVVSAAGRAIDMQEVRIGAEMEAVNFSMKPGGKVRIRVVDEQGQGIPKARIFFQRWRDAHAYFPFDHVNQYADEKGLWQWDEAPYDEFQADIGRPGGMQLSNQSLIARDEEYIFTPPQALVVSGRVIDAVTRQPIDKFRVTPGLRNSDPRIRMNWIPSRSYEASAGQYQIRFTHDYPAHLVQIEAEGYQVAISRDILTNEGQINVDFELQPAEDIAGTLLTMTGEPAAGAKIALGVAGSQISIRNGDINEGSTYALQLTADAEGRFRIPARTEPFQIVITHPSGFAYHKSSDGPLAQNITLMPWARAEGTFRVGAEPAANVTLSLDAGIRSYGSDVPNIFSHYDVTTGEGGRFVIERVFPGQGRIGRRILLMVDQGAVEVTSSQRVTKEFTAGVTTTLELGGSGRPVVGSLVPPADGAEPVLWNFALVNVRVYHAPLPQPKVPAELANDPAQSAAWWATVGRRWQANFDSQQQQISRLPSYTATVDHDGAFRIDDMPAGDYVMDVRFNQQAAGVLNGYRFTLHPLEAEQSIQPLDLGSLQLEKP